MFLWTSKRFLLPIAFLVGLFVGVSVEKVSATEQYLNVNTSECVSYEDVAVEAEGYGFVYYGGVYGEDATIFKQALVDISEGQLTLNSFSWDEMEAYLTDYQDDNGDDILIVVLYRDGCVLDMFESTVQDFDAYFELAFGVMI